MLSKIHTATNSEILVSEVFSFTLLSVVVNQTSDTLGRFYRIKPRQRAICGGCGLLGATISAN